MVDTQALSEAPSPAPSARLDNALNLVLAALILAVIGVAAWFAYSVYADRQSARFATPALRAIEELKVRVQAQPNDSGLRVRLGEALAGAGLDGEAVAQLKTALKLEPKHTGANLDLGLLAMRGGDRKAARHYFEKVIELTASDEYASVNERREVAYFNLGAISLEEKQYEDAAGFFKEALRIRRDASDTYFNLARAYEGLDDMDAAIKQLEIALTFDPNYAQARFELGKIYLKRNDKINAAVQLAMASKSAPNVDVIQEALASLGSEQEWLSKARAAYDAGNVAEAVDDVLVARGLAPDDPAAVKLHARIVEKKGDPKAALAVYREALKLVPGDAEVKAAVERLSKK